MLDNVGGDGGWAVFWGVLIRVGVGIAVGMGLFCMVLGGFDGLVLIF